MTSPSQRCSAAWVVNCRAVASSGLFGANISCSKPLPKSGRFTRSPGLVNRAARSCRGCGRRRRARRAAARVEVKGIVDVHGFPHMALTRAWGATISIGVPVGAHTTCCSAPRSGCPFEVTRWCRSAIARSRTARWPRVEGERCTGDHVGRRDQHTRGPPEGHPGLGTVGVPARRESTAPALRPEPGSRASSSSIVT